MAGEATGHAMTAIDALTPAITLLAVGAAAALASRTLRISPIVGYLLAGLALSPLAAGLGFEGEVVHILAELGVVFLLFDIGMHVSLRELKESRTDLTGLAPTHLLICGAVFSLAIGFLGVDWPIAIAVGVSLALSSTAVVSRILTERGLNSCPLGRSSTHVLIFQDIIAIFLLIFADSLSGDPSTLLMSMGVAAGLAVLAFAAAILAGQYLVGPAFRVLAETRNQEAFTAFSLLVVLGAAVLTDWIGLSLTLGSFLAGLAVSGTAFRHQIQTETGPFRGLLLSFFFISVGLGLNIGQLWQNLPLIVAGALAILILKTAGGYVAARLNKWTVPGATQLAFLMAQGSEFTLVVMSMAAIVAGLSTAVSSIIVASVALSLAIAPFWADGGMRLSRRLAERQKDAASADETKPADRPVIVFGMTPAGRLSIDALVDHDIPYIALDSDPERFLSAVADGYVVSFGDASNLRLVEAIGANHARAIVIGTPRYEVSKSITPTVNRGFPDMKRFVAVETMEDVKRFAALGMRAHFGVAQPHGIEMAADLLAELGLDESNIAAWISRESDRFDVDDATAEVLEGAPEAA